MGYVICDWVGSQGGTFSGYNVFVGRFSVIPAFGFTGISHLPSILAGTNVVEVTGNECIYLTCRNISKPVPIPDREWESEASCFEYLMKRLFICRSPARSEKKQERKKERRRRVDRQTDTARRGVAWKESMASLCFALHGSGSGSA